MLQLKEIFRVVGVLVDLIIEVVESSSKKGK